MRYIILTVALLLASAARADPRDSWEPVRQAEGVSFWQRPEADYSTVTIRSRSVLHAPIANISAVLWDVNHGCDWLMDCRESLVLESPDKATTIQYRRSVSGFLLPDRDVVLQNILSLQPQLKSVRLTFHKVEDARRPPLRFVVRMERFDGYFLLRQLDAHTTEVTYQATMDPGGGVPAFMARGPTLDKILGLFQALRLRLLRADPDGSSAQMRRDFDWSGFVIR